MSGAAAGLRALATAAVGSTRDFHLSTLPPEQLTRKDFRTYLGRARALDAMGPQGFLTLLGL
jgi:hypothetical protein